MPKNIMHREAIKLRKFLKEHNAEPFPEGDLTEGMRIVLVAWNTTRHCDGSRILYLYRNGDVEVGRFVIKKEIVDSLLDPLS